MNIPQIIKSYRELRNYTQQYMAEMLGISQNAYSKIESGKTEISASRLVKISEILSVPVDNFLISGSEFTIVSKKEETASAKSINNGRSINNDNDPTLELLFENFKQMQHDMNKISAVIEELMKKKDLPF